MRTHAAAAAIVLALVVRVWGAEYLTAGVDPQRTGWIKDEKVFTPRNVSGMKLLWTSGVSLSSQVVDHFRFLIGDC